MGIQFFCIEYIKWGKPTIESTFDVANMVKTANVKDVPMNNDALLNIQACQINVWENGICSPLFHHRVLLTIFDWLDNFTRISTLGIGIKMEKK